MKTDLKYTNILAKLQGNIESIILNLKLTDPNNPEIKRLEQALKLSEKATEKLINNK